ncbi:hypothetical protein [Aquabacterium sp.]|uniref:hypothetical protein n=1 Tax=Aquabacterium sp. TaxID=1872578 RepID=UPI002BC58BD8|nr:hypothetical protein [Aquabacterium sp.]HSW06479.1 hypothetical protein [Aquabacterium sp.]
MRGIFYRSDTRSPDANENLFTNGFTKRDVTQVNPTLRNMGTTSVGTDRAPDVEPSSAVCFTSDFFGAPIFPVANLNIPSWVYVLDLDVATVMNTQATQFNLVQNSGANTLAGGAEALWPMFGQERCVNSIAHTDIVGALRVARAFLGTFAQGGTFVCSAYRPNPHYNGGQAVAVAASMNHFIDGRAHSTPTQAGGLVRNTRT